MGVSVRVSRNTRIYMPFWAAIPFGLLVACACVAIIAVIVVGWLVVMLPLKGITAFIDSRDRKKLGEP
jgi:hypothetical protein